MVQFPVPAQKGRSTLAVDTFLGVDYTSDAGSVSTSMSPNGQNMIRDVPGKVRKCMGYEKLFSLSGPVHGFHRRGQDEAGLVHAGNSLYHMTDPPVAVYTQAADGPSCSWQFGDWLYIVDGKALLVWDGEGVYTASEKAKIPLISVAKAPAGGGVDYEALNLLQPKFSERFAGTKTDTVFCLTFSGLDSTPVTAKVLSDTGSWDDRQENTHFTVNRETGKITFKAAPGVSPVTGEDNIEITAARTVTGYADRVNHCDIGTLFGVNGASDRLFLSGNPGYPGRDWYCDQNDPTYWPDIAYSQLGSPRSAIVGYSIINNFLAAHKDSSEEERNVILRQGNLVDSAPAFPIVNTLQGPGALAKRSFAYLTSEPVFLTALGIYAITPSDISGERYSQNRSYFMNGALLNEPGLEKVICTVYKDLYWLCINGAAYILDGLQSLASGRNEPYSNRQYACFYRTNLPATSLWVDDGRLYFGSGNGGVYRFYTDPNALESYADDGQPIHAVWDTPDISGKLFYKNKTFRHLALQLASAVATSVDISQQKRGIWKLVKREDRRVRTISFAQMVFSKFTFSSDETTKSLGIKMRLKRVDKARFRFENHQLHEPFALMGYALEYVESGNFKG